MSADEYMRKYAQRRFAARGAERPLGGRRPHWNGRPLAEKGYLQSCLTVMLYFLLVEAPGR
jgi:hypothetical protein